MAHPPSRLAQDRTPCRSLRRRRFHLRAARAAHRSAAGRVPALRSVARAGAVCRHTLAVWQLAEMGSQLPSGQGLQIAGDGALAAALAAWRRGLRRTPCRSRRPHAPLLMQQPLALALVGHAAGLQVEAVHVGIEVMHWPLRHSTVGHAEVPSEHCLQAMRIWGQSVLDRHTPAPLVPPDPELGVHGGKNVWHLPRTQSPFAQLALPSGHS